MLREVVDDKDFNNKKGLKNDKNFNLHCKISKIIITNMPAKMISNLNY